MIEVGEDGVTATQAIPEHENFRALDGEILLNTDFELLYGFGDDRKTDLFFLHDDSAGAVSIDPAEDSRLLLDKISVGSPDLPPVSFKTFRDLHKLLMVADKNCDYNSEIVLHCTGKKVGFYLRSTREIETGEKISVKFSRENWLRHQLLLTDNPFLRVILLIFLETFKKPLPSKYKPFEDFFVKWKGWSDEVCLQFLTTVLKVEMTEEFLESLNCRGYPDRTVLYRMLQTVGASSPPSGAEYKHYPEALRNLTHQSRDLCFWPVQIAEETEQTEVLRRKMFDGLEFGPNTTWTNFPKTKQIFMSAKRDDLANIKQVLDDSVNLNAFGTCKLWTPLHVACFYGSQKVARFLLEKGVIFNSRDRDGKTPLNLAEDNGHSNLAKVLIGHAAGESTLPDDGVELRKLPLETDPKMSTLEAAVNCKKVGNNAFKNKNYKSAFNLYSRGIELCPDNHPQKVILLSNRAQILITVKAYNLALRDINCALEIDPLHDKTILRRAHCYDEISDPGRSLMDLDLLLYISVPDKFIHNRRSELFLKTLVTKTEDKKEEVESSQESLIKIGGEDYSLDQLPMSSLLDLSLDDLRDLDRKVGLFDCKQ